MMRTTTIGEVTLSVAAVSHVGLRRKHNEDAPLAQPPVLLVADGMGGYEAGDRAAAAIVGAFAAAIPPGTPTTLEDLRDALVGADEAVAEVADGTVRGAGATIAGAVLVLSDGVPSWVFFNVGDARVYRHRGSTLQQVTVDHSLGQELFAAGRISAEELAVFPDRNVVTRAIGASDSRADSWIAPVRHGERIVVCSDGLPSEVPDELIRTALSAGTAAEEAAEELVALALRGGGRDNVTVVIADVVGGGSRAADDEPDDGFFLEETTEPARRR